MSRLSILIPVYNKEKLIESCLESILSQTLCDIEILCLDDGSADGSLEVVKKYAEADSRIRVLSHSNVGAGATRNRGILEAKGKYVAFMDADDMYPNKDVLRIMYEKAEATGSNICGGEWSEIFADGKPITDFNGEYARYRYEKEGTTQYSDYQYDYGYHRFIYKRKFLLDNKIMFPSYLRYQDPPFLIKAMMTSQTFYAIKIPTYLYRKGDSHINWNTERVCDLIKGMIESLRYANLNNYYHIQYLIYKRVTYNYKGQIASILNSPDKSKLIPLLRIVGVLVNYPLIQRKYQLEDENKIFSMIDGDYFIQGNGVVAKCKRAYYYYKRNGAKRTIKKYSKSISGKRRPNSLKERGIKIGS